MATHVYQLSINSNIAGQFASNVVHYQFDDGGYASTVDAANALCNGWSTNVQPAWLLATSLQTTLLSLKSRLVGSTGGFEAVKVIAGGTVGARTGNLASAAISPVLIFFPTANAKPRGRLFIPGVSDTDCVDGILTNAFHTVLATTAATMLTPFALIGGGVPTATPVIYSRKAPPTAYTIQAAQISSMIGQVRRRQVPA